MAKYYGAIGYVETKETRPGVWLPETTERNYYGDLLKNNRRLESSDGANNDLNISNQISIVSDAYALQNFHAIRYATYMGVKWKITNVEVQHPRLLLTLGGVWNDG